MRCRDKGVSRSGAGASRLRKALELAVEARHLVLVDFGTHEYVPLHRSIALADSWCMGCCELWGQ